MRLFDHITTRLSYVFQDLLGGVLKSRKRSQWKPQLSIVEKGRPQQTSDDHVRLNLHIWSKRKPLLPVPIAARDVRYFHQL